MEVIWSGADKHVYLCISEPEPDSYTDRPLPMPFSAPEPSSRRNVSRTAMRERILAFLANGQEWQASQIQALLGHPSSQVFWGVICRARRDGVIAQVSRRGYLEKGRR